MKEQFLQKIYTEIEHRGLIAAGDCVIAGVSGGADSMCLLAVLAAYRERTDYTLRVIHVEHGIRGADSLSDARYVEQYCAGQNIPCQVVRVQVPRQAAENGTSIEETARTLRYEAFERAADEAQAAGAARVRIAVAHHREDQAETLLWQAIRGSDLRGLGGMRWERGRLIRPLLDVSRADIEAYLREAGIGWREDATNADPAYTRNRLRLQVLPVLGTLNAQAVSHLCGSAMQLQETEDYLAAQTQILSAHLVHECEGGWLIDDGLVAEALLMQRRVIYQVLTRAAGAARDLSRVHVSAVQQLFGAQTGRSCDLPYGLCAKRVYAGVQLLHRKEDDERAPEASACGQVHMQVIENTQGLQISKKKYTKWFDYDKIEHHVQIRGRQSGDYLTIDDQGHRQTLKKYLINEKIPQQERGALLLVADGSHILWVIGHRISDYYKVDASTRRILQIQYSGGNEDE